MPIVSPYRTVDERYSWPIRNDLFVDGKTCHFVHGIDQASAGATRGEGMSGTWKEEGNSAVITWSTGWVTKIRSEDGRYRKAAYKKGQSLEGQPANSSDAEKIK